MNVIENRNELVESYIKLIENDNLENLIKNMKRINNKTYKYFITDKIIKGNYPSDTINESFKSAIFKKGYQYCFVTELHANEYYKLIVHYVKKNLDTWDNYENYLSDPMNKINIKECEEYKTRMLNNEKAPLPILDFKEPNQDGIHRIGASYLLKEYIVPCLILY